MFVQFIEGRVTDREALAREYDAWRTELGPGATGWLGSVAGVTDDGIGFVAARFATEEDARRNSARTEQGDWWERTSACFTGPVEFTDCPEVELVGDGGSDDAGFVQVIRGRMADVEAALATMRELDPTQTREDVLGGYVGVRPDGDFGLVVYFTSEADAREGERRNTDRGDDMATRMDALLEGPPRFLDLTAPWLASP